MNETTSRGATRSLARKTAAVLRLLRGEPLHVVSDELGIPTDRLAAWSRAFLHGGEVFLSHLDQAAAANTPAPILRFGPGAAWRPRFASPRDFRPWDYHPASRRLVLRSRPTRAGERQLDIRFETVFYCELMDLYAGVTLDAPSARECEILAERVGQPADDRHFYFAVTTRVPLIVPGKSTELPLRRYFIGAGSLVVEEGPTT